MTSIAMLMPRAVKAFRMRIAQLLDRYPDTCWATLVMWAQFPECHRFREIFRMRHTAGFCDDQPYYYCGKCEPDPTEAADD